MHKFRSINHHFKLEFVDSGLYFVQDENNFISVVTDRIRILIFIKGWIRTLNRGTRIKRAHESERHLLEPEPLRCQKCRRVQPDINDVQIGFRFWIDLKSNCV